MTPDVPIDDARAFLARAQRAFENADPEAVLELFHDDVVVVFADFPMMRGKPAYREFLRARFARQLHYRPTTTVRMVSGNQIGSSWEATWIDARTGKAMRGRGCEFVTLLDGLVIDFVVAFNAWCEVDGPQTPIV
jgi:ketosteroid isomerase-like protein